MSVEWKAAQVEFAIDPIAYFRDAFEEAITRRSDTVWQDACLFVGATSKGIVWKSTGPVEAKAVRGGMTYHVKIEDGEADAYITYLREGGESRVMKRPHAPRKVGRDVW